MDDRLRVLSVVYNLYRGGHENRLLSIARHINRERFDFRVLSISERIDETRFPEAGPACMWPDFERIGIQVRCLGEVCEASPDAAGLKRVMSAAPAVGRMVWNLARLLRREKIDVVDAHHTTAMCVTAAAARLAGVPLFLTSYHVQNWSGRAMKLPGQFTLGSASALVTDSQARGDEIRRWLWRCPPLHVIPTGLERPRSERSKSEVRQLLGLPADDGRAVVGFVGGLVPFKGQMDLIEAAAQVLQSCPETLFVCVGFGRDYHDYEASLQRRIEELNLRGKFFISAYPHGIGDVWPVIDVQAHPSRLDSLPLVIIEGMACGKPIAATSVGGIPEVIRHEHTGLLVPSADPAAMATALIRLLRNPDQAARLGQTAAEFYAAHLTPAAMTTAIENLYLSLAGRDQVVQSRAA